MKNILLYNMLLSSAEADKAKAKLTLDLLGNYPAGIGDHSGKDFYQNAEEALQLLVDAEDRIKTLKKHYNDSF